MRLPTLLERVEKAAHNVQVSLIKQEGLTPITPGVMMFYGVRRNHHLLLHGKGRPEKFLALVGSDIIIENYEN